MTVEILGKTGNIMDLAGIFYDPDRKPVSIEEMNEAIGDAVVTTYLESVQC